MRYYSLLFLACVACETTSGSAVAHPNDARQNNGFEWATIAATGNPAYQTSNPDSLANGRGRVNYAYRIGKTEVTTGQWLEFVNAIAPLTNDPLFFGRPSFWGARDGAGPAGFYELRPDVPSAAMLPVFGVTWHEAAMFCNWLHNDKQASLVAIANGAYDIATFGYNSNGSFTDQLTHNAGARFWIPTFDEWIKAVHYDPNKNGPGQGGWWTGPYGSDALPVQGWPGVGQTSGGQVPPPPGLTMNYDIPLGAYSGFTTPWGLLDASGAAREWTEGVYYTSNGAEYRIAEGLATNDVPGIEYLDEIDYGFALGPGGEVGGLRIASVIPAPGFFAVGFIAMTTTHKRKRP